MGKYRLPNGETCNNAELFASVWREAAKPIEVFTGLKLYAFDPGFYFSDKYNLRTLDLPAWFVLAIGSHLPNKCTDRAYLELVTQREQWAQEREDVMKTWVERDG